MNLYLGVDPGADGAIAALYGNTAEVFHLGGRTLTQWWDHVRGWAERAGGVDGRVRGLAALERVGGYVRRPGESGGAGQPGSAMFAFGATFGALRGFLIAAAVPFVEVTPQRWQRAVGISPREKRETRSQWKGRLAECARRLFPRAEFTKAGADALLLAWYAREGR